VQKLGVNDVYGYSGPAVQLLEEFGLTASGIVETVKKTLNN
jgi:transketolase